MKDIKEQVSVPFEIKGRQEHPSEEMISFAMEFAIWLGNSKVQFHLLPMDGDTMEDRIRKREDLMRIFLNEEYGLDCFVIPHK